MFADKTNRAAVATAVFVSCVMIAVAVATLPDQRRPQPGVWVDIREASRAQSSYLTSARVEPLCIRAGSDYFRLMIGVADPQIIAIRMDTQGVLTYQNSPAESVELFDDGTHGDALSGDRVFTIDQVSLAQTPDTIGRSPLRLRNVTFQYADLHEESSSEDLALTLHYVAASLPAPPVTVLAADVRATRYAVSIVAQPAGAFPGQSVDNGPVAQRYYELFPDDRDFLLIAKPFNTGGAPAASFGSVRNDIEGIGLSAFDNSDFYGSSGVLQGVMNVYWANVSPGTLNHELLHRWAAFLDLSLDLARPGGHWGAIGAGKSAFGGPPPYAGSFDNVEYVSGDTYRAWNRAGSVYDYTELELYLMGLVDLADVPAPIAALVNPVFQTYQFGDGVQYSMYTADALRDVSAEEILAVEGNRVPDYAASQRLFRTAMIVAYDRPLTAIELAYYDYAMREYERPSGSSLGTTFVEATGGRAAMSTMLPCPQSEDPDGDAVCTPEDNCPLLANGDQADDDDDGFGDACDACPDFDDAEPCPIPAISQWGLVAMTLVILTAGTLLIVRRS